MEHLGIDVHKRESQICILTPEGEISERRIQSTRRRARRVRRRTGPSVRPSTHSLLLDIPLRKGLGS